MKPLLYVLLLSLPFYSFSQKEQNNWYFGSRCRVTFNNGAPQFVGGSTEQSQEAAASISDRNGKLLFYTDGQSVWDATNTVMPNGSGLSGCTSTTMGALIVPDPADTLRYYVFTGDCIGDPSALGYTYSIINMGLNSGLGDVTTTKNVLLYTNNTEKLAGVINAAHNGYWIITHEYGSNNFVSYELTAGGLSAPVVSATGPDNSGDFVAAVGYLKVSNNTKMLANVLWHTDGTNEIEMAGFDNATGTVTHRYSKRIGNTDTTTIYGAAFSPDDSRLYVSDFSTLGNIYQFDAGAADSNAFYASQVLVGHDISSAILQGPDDRLYIVEVNSPWLDVINQPNKAGTACNFVKQAVALSPGLAEFGLPNFVTGRLGPCTLPAVALTAARTIFCSGDSAAICVTANFSHYHWNTGDTTACVQAKTAGAYYVIARDINNCAAASDTVTILVKPLPQPVINTAKTGLCPQDSVPVCLTANYTSYNWNMGATAICVQAKQAGDYYVTVTDTSGCTAESNHIAINVYPVASVPIIERGDTLSSYGAQAYQWLVNDTVITGATLPQYVAASAGNYTLQITDTNGCITQSEPVLITGLQEITENVMGVYPNPSALSSVQLVVASKLVGSQLEIYDEQGRLVFHSEISNQKLAIDLPFARGVYYLQVFGDNTSVVRKLVRL